MTPEQIKELQKPLDPKFIKPPPQGKYGEYVDAWHIIMEANRIFGFDGWSYGVDQITPTNNAKVGDMHRVGYMAVVTVVVGDQRKGDIGHGQGFSKSEGDAHDSAVKEAVTDALKRALRTFGNPFGLALYDKTKSNVGVHVPDEVLNLIAEVEAASPENVRSLWDAKGKKFEGTEHQSLVRDAFNKRKEAA